MTLYFFWDRIKLILERLPLPFPPEFLFLLTNCSACFLIITSTAKPTHYLNFLYLLPLIFFSEELDYKLLTPSLAVLAFFLFVTIYYLHPPQFWKVFILDFTLSGGLIVFFTLQSRRSQKALIEATDKISQEFGELSESYNQLKAYTEVLEFTNHEMDRKNLNLSEINTLTNILSVKLPLESLVARISSFFGSAFRAEKVWILFLKQNTEIQVFSFLRGTSTQSWLKRLNRKNWFYLSFFEAAQTVFLREEELLNLSSQIFWTNKRPQNLAAIPLLGGEGIFGVIILGNIGSQLLQDDFSLLQILAGQSAIALERVRMYDELEDNYLATLKALAFSIEAKDPYTRGHSERVTKLSIVIGEKMGLTDRELINLKYGGLLHDIGKIGISEIILNKPGSLTIPEYQAIQKHPVIGEEIVSPVAFLGGTLPLIRNHHERFDGLGYPDRLKAELLPLIVRILTVCDAFDAMHSDRPYRRALSLRECKNELVDKSGTQFDPAVVTTLLRLLTDINFPADLGQSILSGN